MDHSMATMPTDPIAQERLSSPRPQVVSQRYHRLLATLTSRARWLGSRDPEGAAQETLKRSLESATSHAAVEYYFAQDPSDGVEPDDPRPPEWPLDQLLAWLHGVLRYVVREEHSRASNRREVMIGRFEDDRGEEDRRPDPVDSAPDPLHILIHKELQAFVTDCFPRLEHEYRTVLTLRADGLKYDAIAARLGVNENTVATWVSRGIRALARCIRRRTTVRRVSRAQEVHHG
jgi:RNA polymerase sigma factor (sigma-70 family)